MRAGSHSRGRRLNDDQWHRRRAACRQAVLEGRSTPPAPSVGAQDRSCCRARTRKLPMCHRSPRPGTSSCPRPLLMTGHGRECVQLEGLRQLGHVHVHLGAFLRCSLRVPSLTDPACLRWPNPVGAPAGRSAGRPVRGDDTVPQNPGPTPYRPRMTCIAPQLSNIALRSRQHRC